MSVHGGVRVTKNLKVLSGRPIVNGHRVTVHDVVVHARSGMSTDESLVVLEGSPGYHPRFGFRPASGFGISIDLPDWAPSEAAMVYPLKRYRPSIQAEVEYPAAFLTTGTGR